MNMLQQVLVVVLTALALLQLVSAQNGVQSTDNHSNRGSGQPTVLNVDQYLLQMNSKLDVLNSKLEVLDASLSQHKEQTAAELAQLQTSLSNKISSTNSKLDALRATAVQLSIDHQQIETSISVVDCMDTESSNHLTQQLESIQEKISTLYNQRFSCGGTGGWRRVVYLDMTDNSTTCPSGWQLTRLSKRTCGKVNRTTLSCDSVTFPVMGGEYSQVCGRVNAYQYGQTDGFEAYNEGHVSTIDDAYVAGVSVTHGLRPRGHIWTFAAGASDAYPTWEDACPCDARNTIRVPPFVGDDYFCESGANDRNAGGFHPDDPLWDGLNCTSSNTCCSFNSPPYFVKHLSTSTSDGIEARICTYGRTDDSPIDLIELYVK